MRKIDQLGRRARSRFSRSNSHAAQNNHQQAPNSSDNLYFGDLIRDLVSRRGVLKAGAVLAVTGAGQAWLGGAAAAAERLVGGEQVDPGPRGVNFVPVPFNTLDQLVVPAGYQQRLVIRWGDPVLPGAPAFNFASQTAAAQARQFGYNNDFCGLVPQSPKRWLMVSNHQYTNEAMMFVGYDPNNPTAEQVRIAWAAHGMSVVLVEDERSGGLSARVHQHNRRITVTTPFVLRGPAAGSDYLKTSADAAGTTVLGTLNNTGGGVTPWGTVLSAEQNFNQYFANANQVTDPVTQARLARYGVVGDASVRKWERFDPRFDLAQEPNEVNRFGWIVEVDPNVPPNQTLVKHTALGRFKHEAATIQVADDGRVVCYMGDGERFEYIYKFVSDEQMRPGPGTSKREHNKRLLDAGTLYVARFTGDSPPSEIDGTGQLPSDGAFDGNGEWIPLAHNDQSFVPGFTADEVYIFTRLAADAVGATKMDRPEDVEASPLTGKVYAALTNNTSRTAAQVDEANPRANNRHGHVLELEEFGGDHTGTTFTWRLLLVCGDPAAPDTYFAGYDKTKVSPISCPDTLTFDVYGNLWIATGGNALASNDGLFAVPVEGTERGHVKQFLTVPIGAETCGPVVEPDFVLVSVQHPGQGGTIAAPTSHWPDGGTSQPRPAVVAVFKPGSLIGE